MELRRPRGFTSTRSGGKNIVSCERCGRTWRWASPYQDVDMRELVDHRLACDPAYQPLWQRYGLDPVTLGLE